VFVPKYGIEGPVYLTPRDDNNRQGKASSSAAATEGAFVLDEKKQMVTSRWGMGEEGGPNECFFEP